MPIQRVFKKGKVPVKVYTEDIAPEAIQQLENMSHLPFIHSHIAAMPDVHLGKGATVGSVIPTKKAIIPAAVGVDIGCGMNAVRLSLKAYQLPDNLKPIRMAIEDKVPVGFAAHKWTGFDDKYSRPLMDGLDKIIAKHPAIIKRMKAPHKTPIIQMGTLGGGNHFIELCLDENNDVWVMLHSGSRGIGNQIGQYFIQLAKKEMQTHHINLPDKDLAYLSEGTESFDDYWFAVKWGQDYAYKNRQKMMALVLDVLKQQLPEFSVTKEAINCHHNYVEMENHFGENVYLTRKGAIRAREGDLGIIPGSMGAKSFIVRGKGNPQSFCSCSHGAGRTLSRTAAKKLFKRSDLEMQTKGVECRKDSQVIDEIPAAYKDIDTVMENQHDLVEVVHTLKQVVCIKG
ncbi:RtcB family protein [Kangiella sp. HZ709]|uniref:RtcB family protein n=1 Tax=Kangiella sp. HZ709 TaxID=2666328 RepID=UPI0012B13B59|nr:RtcB family protein [Kangiella sp. HZ709]MRX27253.1 RtcB family protein [Kangiella sp. HZ709]